MSATLATADTYDIDALEEIPAAFHGRWNSDSRACAPFDGRGRIEISGRRLVVGGDAFEAEYIAMAVEGDGIFVASRYAGPARRWSRFDHFTLSGDGTSLINENAGRRLVRRRCRGR